MISRSLGPEFGGAIGLMFTVANSISVAVYIIGFVESLRDLLTEQIEDFSGLMGGGKEPDIRLIGSVTLVVLLAVTLVGMEWVTRVQKILLILLIAAQADFVIGAFMGPAEGMYRKTESNDRSIFFMQGRKNRVSLASIQR